MAEEVPTASAVRVNGRTPGGPRRARHGTAVRPAQPSRPEGHPVRLRAGRVRRLPRAGRRAPVVLVRHAALGGRRQGRDHGRRSRRRRRTASGGPLDRQSPSRAVRLLHVGDRGRAPPGCSPRIPNRPNPMCAPPSMTTCAAAAHTTGWFARCWRPPPRCAGAQRDRRRSAAADVGGQPAAWRLAADRLRRPVEVRSGKVELGQGMLTALAQMAAEELDIDVHRIRMTATATDLSPDEGMTAGSLSIQQSGRRAARRSARRRATSTSRSPRRSSRCPRRT